MRARTSTPALFAFALLLLQPLSAHADDRVRQETRVTDAWDAFGVSGRGVIIGILDRGIDYEHPDFRNEDGTTRIRYILDVTDPSGANHPDNTAGIGTVYTRAQIDEALSSGTRLATRDAVGHGTSTAGLAGGNGRASNGLYAGMAPEAEFIIVKFTTEGAPAHGSEPAEQPFNRLDLLPNAIDFVLEKAEEAGMPVVMLANFGSIQGPTDGTSREARMLDERFGAGHPGRVFITGTSDDGGQPNHAAGTLAENESINLEIHKGHAGTLRFHLWYDAADRFDVEVTSPSGTGGPYVPPENGAQASAQGGGFSYYHNGSEVDFFGAESATREILIDLFGPTGDYVIKLTGRTVSNGSFHAILNPSNIFAAGENRFESFVVPGYTVWDLATAHSNVAPNSYVLREEWTDVNGIVRTEEGNEVGEGELWPGSGVGPTFDERLGVTVSAPGNSNIAAYSPRSYRSQFPHVHVTEDGLYGIQGAVSGAAPVVTGIIALMLEADPTLDAAEVKDILQRTARQDGFTGEVPNTRWGYGKIDAFAAVAEVISRTASEPVATLPNQIRLHQNYPNPFNPATTIRFEVGAASKTRLTVHDVLGRELAVLVDGSLAPGDHTVTFDAGELPSGVYLYRLQAEDAVRTGVMTLLR